MFKAKIAAGPIDPLVMFKEGDWAGRFSSFAEDGMPLTDDTGEPLAKSQLKKLARLHEQQKGKWDKWSQRQGADPASATKAAVAPLCTPSSNADSAPEVELATWLSADVQRGGAICISANGEITRVASEELSKEPLEDERARLVWGTFGGRQSWEAMTTGPFTHLVNF